MKKEILITGAGSGMGQDAALALAARGHTVHATTQTEQQADALRALAAEKGVPLKVFKLDITQEADRLLIAPLPLDVLINNAGIGESGSLAEVPMDRIRQVFEVNLFSTLALTQIALRGMIARQRGTVLLVSSIAGRVPIPFLMPYGMSKFALSAAGAGLRAELKQLGCNVHVSLIEPGAIHTGFNQTMAERKYTWMGKQSYFASHVARLKAEEARTFSWVEAKSTQGIVAQFVKASEAARPRLRYVSPWAQGLMVRLARIAGI
jgi:short-subunit dehydrogenase